VVNGKLFYIFRFDVGKRTQNSSMCMPTVDGETYFRKLMKVIEIEYFDRTKYIMLKCDWVDSTRDKRYKVDEYGLIFVNFKILVHRGEMIIDKPYVLTL
jgi:hypothetical protein